LFQIPKEIETNVSVPVNFLKESETNVSVPGSFKKEIEKETVYIKKCKNWKKVFTKPIFCNIMYP